MTQKPEAISTLMDAGTVLPGIQHTWVSLYPRHLCLPDTEMGCRAARMRYVTDARDRQQCSLVGIGIAWPSDIGRRGTNPES